MAAEEPVLPPVAPLTDEDFEGRRTIFTEIFADAQAQDIKMKSLAERQEKELAGVRSLTYGEIDISILHKVLKTVVEEHGPLYAGKGAFVDLGSGAGKACIAAGLLHPFEKVVGIELLECLNGLAGAADAKYKEAQLPEGVAKPEMSFVKGDFVLEYDSLLEPLAEATAVCLAVATMYGEEQLGAMAKFAERMPDGSIFITFTQELLESLLVDVNRNPKQRCAAATKKALAVRGKAPEGIEVVVELAPNSARGWKKVHSEDMELMWGATSCHVFKKYGCPYCNPGEVCMATLPDDSAAYLAKYVDSTHAIFMDGTSEEPCEVVVKDEEGKIHGKMEALTTEGAAAMLKTHAAAQAAAKQAEAEDPKAQVAAAVQVVADTVGLKHPSHQSEAEGLICYAAVGAVSKESECLVRSLAKGVPTAGPPARTVSHLLSKYDAACREKDEHKAGGVSEAQAVEIWTALRTDFLHALESNSSVVLEDLKQKAEAKKQ